MSLFYDWLIYNSYSSGVSKAVEMRVQNARALDLYRMKMDI